MKLLKNLLFIVTTLLLGCTPDEALQDQRWVDTLLEADERGCPCCRYTVKIEGKPHLVEELPAEFQDFLNRVDMNFLVKVRLRAEPAKGNCPARLRPIKVLEIMFAPR